jgi:hypothetical protein
MRRVCPYIDAQLDEAAAKLYTQQFRAHAKAALQRFQALYPTCKHDRLAIQILLVMHLSSQERVQCRAKQDVGPESTSDDVKFLKRWQTREIARGHLGQHLPQIETVFGKTIKDLVGGEPFLGALGYDDIEFWLKGFKSSTLTAIDLMADAGGDADRAKKTFEIALILYHTLTATRPSDGLAGHWAQTINAAQFAPWEAKGFTSLTHYKSLYGDGDGSQFSDPAKAKINALWNALGDRSVDNRLPAHPRFADAGVDRDNLLEAVEKHYLQYLPRFDHPEANRDRRSACETTVRTRVRIRLKAFRKKWLEQNRDWHKETFYVEPTVEFEEVDLAGTDGSSKTVVLRELLQNQTHTITFQGGKLSHVAVALTVQQRTDLQTFMDLVQNADTVRGNGCKLRFRITNETGNTRRTNRRQNVKDALQGMVKKVSLHRGLIAANGDPIDWDENADALLDDLYVKMRDNFCVDQAFDLRVERLIEAAADAGHDFSFKGWFPIMLQDVAWSRAFPACGFGGGTFAAIDQHYAASGEGTSARPAHYLDWRCHKDHWLYDCFRIKPRRRPLFSTLSVQPILPEVNPNYGTCAVFYKPARVNSRYICTLGDKQQPVRSMLLLLDTIIFGRKKKDGDGSQSVSQRQPVLSDLMRRYDYLTSEIAGGTPEQLWEATVSTPKRVPYPVGDLIIECQVFGPVTLRNDALAIAYGAVMIGGEPPEVGQARTKLTAAYPGVKFFVWDRGKRTIQTPSMMNNSPEREAILVDDVEAIQPLPH